MNIRLSHGPRIPQLIALLLFCGGSFFALILLPLTVLFAFDSDGWGLCAYFICGYLVYFGWFWRVWHTPSKPFATSLWILAFIQNSAPWIFILQSEHWHLPTLRSFQTHGAILGINSIVFGWWSVASILSLVALIFDLLQRTHDA
jgi:hypothetical protein